MFVIAKVRDQVIARFFRGSFGAEKLCAHVVIDPKDMRAISRETPHAFRANQSAEPVTMIVRTNQSSQSSMSPRRGRIHSRGGKLPVAREHTLD